MLSMHHAVAVRCGVLSMHHAVAVRCGVLSMHHAVAVRCGVLSMHHAVAVRCGVLSMHHAVVVQCSEVSDLHVGERVSSGFHGEAPPARFVDFVFFCGPQLGVLQYKGGKSLRKNSLLF